MKIFIHHFFSCGLMLFGLLLSTEIEAQKNSNATEIALNYLKIKAKSWGLTESDIADVAVQYNYETQHNGLTHVFLIQRKNGIEVYNAIVNVNVLPSGEVLFAGNRFIPNLKINATAPTLSPVQALSIAASDVGLLFSEKNTPLSIVSKNESIFEDKSVSHQKMTVKLLFFPNIETGESRLVWDINIDATNSDDHWSIRIDAMSGAVLDKKSLTLHCSFDEHFLKNQETDCPEHFSYPLSKTSVEPQKMIETTTLAGNGTYRVFKLPTESPLYGNSILVDDPADVLASPYGWHDTSGTVGADFTITRGNNAHAFLDLYNRNVSQGDEPNGGQNLVFDYPYSPFASADSVKNAATVNLFYMTNMMHDISFRYGFDEVAGNFQQKNYTGQGRGNDHVLSQAQDGGKLPDPTLNNANFSPPVDGLNGRMQMYLWSRRNLPHLEVTAPASLVRVYNTGVATFGPRLPFTPISGQVVLFNDGTANPTRACNPSKVNLAGKIALIDRGTSLSGCSYARKIINAQDSGAIAVIICYNSTTTPNVFGDTIDELARQVRIPSIIMSSTDCDRLKLAVGNDLQVRLFGTPADTVGVDFVDGDFDNGIIAHEYGHGISTRLTGGPLNSSCLSQGEQMGEGWSDFFAMITSAKPGDRGNMARGMGNFALRQNTNGVGIRRYPYSTDMTINPHTYNNIYLNQASPHPIGEIWATTIWDLYWAMVDKYGWNADITNRTSGNGKAIQLVMDGMKLQPCNPGFLDGRDAILAADRANNNGENQCLIWEVFARRGMGVSAKQGLGSRATDNVEAFDVLPTCSNALKFTKSVSSNINAGETFDVSLKVINYKKTTAKNLAIRDVVPDSASFVGLISPTTGPISITFPNQLAFPIIDSLRSGDSLEIKYRLRSSASKTSKSQLFEGFERPTILFDSLIASGSRTWARAQDTKRPLGKRSVMAANGTGTSDQLLSLTQPILISGKQPVVRFWHRFNTEGGNDSGIFEAYVENDTGWQDLSSKMFRNNATGPTYLTYPFKTQAFWGVQDSFEATYVDLKDFVGKKIQVRFYFKSNATINSTGWFVDDLLFFDMVNYQSTARLTSSQGDNLTAEAAGRGTIVEPDLTIPTKEVAASIGVNVFPNPTNDVVNVDILTEIQHATISLMSIEGKVLVQQKLGKAQNWTPLSMQGLPNGLYFLKVETDKGYVVKKVVKSH
ncbi:MAG: M36 family metallopeptidase [Saprospiraceae bacterium]|nr:M36 family metallopeptidase [Saprospiraceae bacterium]